MSMAKPCATLKRRHTKSTGCLVHKSKNPGRSPASNYITLSDQSNFRQIGPGGGNQRSRLPQSFQQATSASERITSRGISAKSSRDSYYFTSTVAPASVNFFRMVSASSLLTPSLIGFGAPSTKSLASLSPRLVTSRTALITLILFAPAAVRITLNSVFSSAAGAAAAAPPAGAAATVAAAAETPSFSSSNLTSCDASSNVSP